MNTSPAERRREKALARNVKGLNKLFKDFRSITCKAEKKEIAKRIEATKNRINRLLVSVKSE